jgi:hypothetical protein
MLPWVHHHHHLSPICGSRQHLSIVDIVGRNKGRKRGASRTHDRPYNDFEAANLDVESTTCRQSRSGLSPLIIESKGFSVG